MKALIVAEYYPRAGDPVGGIWAHRQTLAARDAGADVRVLVLHRPVPPLSAVRTADVGRALSVVRQPATAELDGLPVHYVRYLSPPRPWSYSSWGAWAAPAAAPGAAPAAPGVPVRPGPRALRRADRRRGRRAAGSAPLVVSVHGHDVQGAGSGGPAVATTLRHARLVLANSAGTARRCAALGARDTRVVHLGADVPPTRAAPWDRPTLVTVGHLAARKRHADVISALALLRDRHPRLDYVIIGDGPERERLAEHAASLGVADRIEFRGQLPNAEATAVAGCAALFVMPSVDEAFGVAYIEAMAAGFRRSGVAARTVRRRSQPRAAASSWCPLATCARWPTASTRCCSDRPALVALGGVARDTVEREFTWDRCGAQTVAAYEHVLGGGS